MNVLQSYQIVNDIVKEQFGESAIVVEDVSSLIKAGTQVFNAQWEDNFVKKLLDRIGKTIYVNRKLNVSIPSVYKDKVEFGSILQKIDVDIPIATENQSWKIQNGASYDDNVVSLPSVSVTYWNDKSSWEIRMTYQSLTIKEAFTSGEAMAAFISAIENAVDNGITARINFTTKRLINNMISLTIKKEFGTAALTSKVGTMAINLLKAYNDEKGLTGANALTTTTARHNADYCRFAAYKIGLISSYLKEPSALYNIAGKIRWSDEEHRETLVLADFAKDIEAFSLSDTFNPQYTALGNYTAVANWQGNGQDNTFAKNSKIYITDSDNNTLEKSNILAVIYDTRGVMLMNENYRVTSKQLPSIEATNYWYKWDEALYCDKGEQFVVFFEA